MNGEIDWVGKLMSAGALISVPRSRRRPVPQRYMGPSQSPCRTGGTIGDQGFGVSSLKGFGTHEWFFGCSWNSAGGESLYPLDAINHWELLVLAPWIGRSLECKTLDYRQGRRTESKMK